MGLFSPLSLPDKWLLVCRSNWFLNYLFCAVQLYSLFPTFVLVKCLGFSMHNALSFASNDSFYFFPSDLSDFYFFSCLLALTRTCNTVLNKSGKHEHPGTCSCSYRESHSFLALNMMFTMGLLCGLYYVGGGIPHIHFIESFYHESVWILSHAFSTSIELIISL